jgi:hypothetical protein
MGPGPASDCAVSPHFISCASGSLDPFDDEIMVDCIDSCWSMLLERCDINVTVEKKVQIPCIFLFTNSEKYGRIYL